MKWYSLVCMCSMAASPLAAAPRYVQFDGTLVSTSQEKLNQVAKTLTRQINYLDDLLRKASKPLPQIENVKKAAKELNVSVEKLKDEMSNDE